MPTFVKQFTSSEANASQNQEQLKLESFPSNWGIEQNKSEILSLRSGGSPHYESRCISPLAIVFHFSSEVILIKLICMSIYW